MATKPLLNPLSRFLLNTFLIPGGVFFGGLYMMWLTLSRGIVDRPASATLTAFIQSMIALILGLSPAHGFFSTAVFLLPGITIDLVFQLPGTGRFARGFRFLSSCALANTVGITMVALVRGFAHVPLMILLVIGLLSGCLGGAIALVVVDKMPSNLSGLFSATRGMKKSGTSQAHPASDDQPSDVQSTSGDLPTK
jgi:hypothetical protein